MLSIENLVTNWIVKVDLLKNQQADEMKTLDIYLSYTSHTGVNMYFRYRIKEWEIKTSFDMVLSSFSFTLKW